MVRHVVLFKIKASVSQEAIETAFNLLKNLKTKNSIPGIISISGGKCLYHQNKKSDAITHGFIIDFESQDVYDQFLSDPATYPAKGCLLNLVEGSIDGLFGFDLGKEDRYSPNPLDKYRVPKLMLLPPGSIRR